MLKKIIFTILLLTIAFIFCINYTFAADDTGLKDAANNVRNMVGETENGIENAAKDISNTSKDVTSDIENKANNATSDIENKANNATSDVENRMDNDSNKNPITGTTTNSNPGDYSASRTSTATDRSILGINSTTWIWLIMAIVAIAIIAMVYYFSVRSTGSNNYHDDNYEE